MTNFALTLAGGLIAFSGPASFLFLLTYEKAQLAIVVTTSAFAFLLSALLSALLWMMLSFIPVEDERARFFLLVIPGVLCQALLRCLFVAAYHKVEAVVEDSIRRHEVSVQEAAAAHPRRRGGGGGNQPQQSSQDNDAVGTAASIELSTAAKFRLELNDASCGLAAGVGFGGMHAVLLYGTFLASELDNGGTLYQDSCGVALPGLVHGAILAALFFILDLLLMLLTFYAARRMDWFQNNGATAVPGSGDGISGEWALAGSLVAHFAASISTLPNSMTRGCVVSLPLVVVTVALTALGFYRGIGFRHYLPTNQRRRISTDATSEAAADIAQTSS